MDEPNIECGLLETSDLQSGMETFIEKNDIDVLALTTHKRNFFNEVVRAQCYAEIPFPDTNSIARFQCQLRW